MTKRRSGPPATPSPDELEEIARVLGILAVATRLKILYTVAEGEPSVGDVAAATSISTQIVSKHVAYFRTSGLISVRKEGHFHHLGLTAFGRKALAMVEVIRKQPR